MGLLTPDEFIKIFPVEKHYDGGRNGNKDYFSTMDEWGVHPMRMMTDHDGKQFLYDPDKKTTYPVMKKYPRYLKLVN